MSNLLLGRTSLARFVKNWRQNLRLALTARRSDFGETRRFFVSQVNAVLLKDCDSKKGNFSESSSGSQSNNPCGGRTSNDSEIASESSRQECSGQTSSASRTNSCDSDQGKSTTETCQSETSKLDDSGPRDCKLLANSFPKSTTVEKCHLELTPSPFLPPSKEDEKRRKFWKLITLLGALPVSLITSLIVKSRIEEESKRPRPKYVPMEYMYRRTKRFPWGDGNHTFFHNPERNPVPPDGYEVEDPNQVKTND